MSSAEEKKVIKLLERIHGSLEVIAGRLGPRHDRNDFLSTQEAAAFLKCSKQQVLVFVGAGLPHYTIGKEWKFKFSDLIDFVENFRKERTFAPRVLHRAPARIAS
jgi:excisionase family DNA binding protein